MPHLQLPLRDIVQAPNHIVVVELEQPITDFPSLVPVQATVTVAHRTTFLEARGTAATIVTLTCQRCLRHYNYRHQIDFEEILWIDANAEAEPESFDISPDDLTERIAPNGIFDVEDWVYQHLWLLMPQKQVCEADCPGILPTNTEETALDSRWATLKNLQDHLH